MLTDLSFLQPGKPWCPPEEKERIERYHDHKELFNGKHAKVYEEQFKRIDRVINNFSQVISYPVVINYQKLITLKIIDLLLTEAPKIQCENNQEAVDQIIENSDLINTTYKVCIDTSRYGDGLFYIGENINATQPLFWYAIVDPFNSNVITNHVLAYEQEIGEDSQGRKIKQLIAQIHYKGYYELKTFKLITSMGIGTYIGDLISEETVPTNLEDFAIQRLPNLQTTDCIYGHDDYTDLDSLVSEILVRVAQISKILDKHSAPSVQGPVSALEQDPVTGEWKLKMGSYFMVDSKDDPKVEYLTWDGQLESAFKQLEFLINTLLMVSEVGSTLIGEKDSIGSVSSGSALRLKLITPQIKAKRLRNKLDYVLKHVVSMNAKYHGIQIKENDISITWKDGIPNDKYEEAQIMDIRTGRKATISQKTALMTMDDLTEEQAEEEMTMISEDSMMANPITTPPFSNNGNGDVIE